jgi:hypothetical protein
MSDTPSVITPSEAQLKSLHALLRVASDLCAAFGVDPLPFKVKGKRSKAAKAASSDGEATKPKRTLNPEGKVAKLNVERMAVFNEMRESWLSRFPQFSEQARAAWAPDATAAVKKTFTAAVKASGVESCPTFPQALQEHSKRRAAENPEAAAKHAAYRAALDEKRSQASGSTAKDSASVVSAPEAPAKKKGGRKPMTPEQKAAAKAKRDADKAAKSAPAPSPAPAPVAVVETSVVKADDGDEEAFKTWNHKGKDYFKNGLNYVYSKNSKGGFGEYVGQYDPIKRKIDESVPEPEADSDGDE